MKLHRRREHDLIPIELGKDQVDKEEQEGVFQEMKRFIELKDNDEERQIYASYGLEPVRGSMKMKVERKDCGNGEVEVKTGRSTMTLEVIPELTEKDKQWLDKLEKDLVAIERIN